MLSVYDEPAKWEKPSTMECLTCKGWKAAAIDTAMDGRITTQTKVWKSAERIVRKSQGAPTLHSSLVCIWRTPHTIPISLLTAKTSLQWNTNVPQRHEWKYILHWNYSKLGIHLWLTIIIQGTHTYLIYWLLSFCDTHAWHIWIHVICERFSIVITVSSYSC